MALPGGLITPVRHIYLKTNSRAAKANSGSWNTARTASCLTTSNPYHLTTGRVLFHWHGGTMTRSSRLEEAFPVPIVEMHPADAGALAVVSGDWLRITSRRGAVECQVMVTGRSPAGTLFLPFHFVEAAANLLTLDKVDPRAKIPDFKMAAVKLEKVERAATILEEQGAIKDPVRYVH